MIPAHRPLRSGAALIIALVILAALMLLGLPFIFSQSGALAGTRAFARGQTAQVGMGAAENSGIGLAGNAAARHMLQGASVGLNADQEWSRVDWDLNISYANPLPGTATLSIPPWAYLDAPGQRYLIDWLSTPLASAAPLPDQVRRDLLGLTIEDEGGKLDPNHLDADGWQRLLKAVDPAFYDPSDPADHDPSGQLAKALASLRFTLPPTYRITDLSQLLNAQPTGAGHRQHLTKAELAHLRPHLSLVNLAQARAGLIDLGTIVGVDAFPGSPYLDSVPPSKLLAFPVNKDLVGAGSVLVASDAAGNQQFTRLRNIDLSSASPFTLAAGSALAIEAPPAVNIHEATPPTLAELRVPGLGQAIPVPLPATPTMPASTIGNLRTIAVQPDARTTTGAHPVQGPALTAFDLLDPLADYNEAATGTVGPTVVGDGAMPAFDGDGTPLVVEGATLLHLQGVNPSLIPRSGYARIHGNHAGSNLPASGGNPAVPALDGPDVYISYSYDGSTQLYNVTLVSLRPGVPAISASFRVEAGMPTITFISPHEQAPLAIATPGIVTIDSSATVTDAQGKPDAKRGRRVIAQTVPQESPLETRWVTQSQIHALLASRQGSLLTSFPNPIGRLTDMPPSDQVVVPGTGIGADPDAATGFKAAILAGPNGNFLGINPWTRTFSGTAQAGTSFFLGDGTVTTSGAAIPPASAAQNMTPEGWRVVAGQALSYPNAVSGFLREVADTSFGGANVLAPFTFAIWVKPTQSIAGVVTVFEMRMPAANVGTPLPGTPIGTIPVPRSTDAQNRISLRYIGGTVNQFSLIVNNGAIEHAMDYGPKIDVEDFSNIDVDPQSQAPVATDALPLAPARGNQTIKLRYFMGAQGLQPNVWHLVQGVVAANAPGGMSLIVDGLVGREATRLNPVALTLPGDHVTLPTLVLRTALGAHDVSVEGRNALLSATIKLDACTSSLNGAGMDVGGSAVKDLLPQRGMIRIGSEYLSYSGIDNDGVLSHVVRARRQDTYFDGSGAAAPWPVVPAHATGNLVVPGGYRVAPAVACQLYQGGCKLAGPLPDGLNRAPALPMADFQNVTYLVVPVPAGILVQPTSTSIAVSNGNIAVWPDHGIVRINSGASRELVYYSTRTETPVNSGTYVLDGLQRARLGTTSLAFSSSDTTFDKSVTLVSIEATGANPTDPGRYKASPGDRLIQLYDPAGGRIEWLTYTDIDYVTSESRGFFVDRDSGFNWKVFDPANPATTTSSRGRERTQFIPGAADFNATTLILPVQTELAQVGCILATGDILTIAPRAPTPTLRPIQVCVRYVPCDAYSAPVSPTVPGPGVDTHNHYFAFTDEVTGIWSSTGAGNGGAHAFDLLCWPCWSADTDLSPYQPVTSSAQMPPWQMPWSRSFASAFATDPAVPDDRRVYFGSLDDRVNRYPTTLPSLDPFPGLIDTPMSATVDAPTTLTSISPAPPAGQPWLAAGEGASVGFTFPNAFAYPHDRGLMLVGDEVLAYRRDGTISTTAVVIGRGLLGSGKVAHYLGERLIMLPVGPVAELGSTMPVGGIGRINLSDAVDAPAVLLSSADGNRMEMVALPLAAGSNQGTTAPWLRGLYGTQAIAWDAPPAGTGPHLAIGWWPRYASALPHDDGISAMSLDGAQTAALLRCRTYAWASFPVRYYDTFFRTSKPPAPALPPPFILDYLQPVPGPFAISYAALDRGPSWNLARFLSIDTDSSQLFVPTGTPPSSPFTNGTNALPVDGAEIRIIWRYANAPLAPPPASDLPGLEQYRPAFLTTLAADANQAPMFGTAKLLANAPSKILAVVPP